MNTLKPLCVETEETNDFSSEHPTIWGIKINDSESYYERTKYLLQGNNLYEFGITGFHNTIKLALTVTLNYRQPAVNGHFKSPLPLQLVICIIYAQISGHLH